MESNQPLPRSTSSPSTKTITFPRPLMPLKSPRPPLHFFQHPPRSSTLLSTPISISIRPCGVRTISSIANPGTFRPARSHSPPLRFRSYSSQKPKQYIIDLTPTSTSSSSKKWSQLSPAQKVARTASTGTNLLTIVAGIVLTTAVITLFYIEVLSPDSKTNWFNRAISRIKCDARCLSVLGPSSSIKAYGEPTAGKWTRNRPIASTTRVDRHGVEHFLIHFNVEGSLSSGVVHVHLIKRPGQDEYDYKYLYLDVPGHQRIYLENIDTKPTAPKSQKKGLFGVRWG